MPDTIAATPYCGPIASRSEREAGDGSEGAPWPTTLSGTQSLFPFVAPPLALTGYRPSFDPQYADAGYGLRDLTGTRVRPAFRRISENVRTQLRGRHTGKPLERTHMLCWAVLPLLDRLARDAELASDRPRPAGPLNSNPCDRVHGAMIVTTCHVRQVFLSFLRKKGLRGAATVFALTQKSQVSRMGKPCQSSLTNS